MRPSRFPLLRVLRDLLTAGILVAAGAAASLDPGAAVGLLQRVASVGVLAAPLVTSLGRDEALENAHRRDIYRIVREDPGVCASEVADRAGLAWGTVIYHLQALEETRYVASIRHGRHRRFFENGGVAEDKEALATLQRETTADVYEAVREEPGLPQQEIAEAVGMSPSALAWHLEELAEAGLVERERDGRKVRYHAADEPLAPA